MKRKILSNKKSKNPYWKTFESMQNELKKANDVLKKDLKRKNINWKKVQKDSNKLMLLLGECNYIAQECKHCKKKGRWA